MICVLDFETSGLPQRNMPVNINSYMNFPRAVQVCAILYDSKTSTELSRINEILKIDDFIIPEESISIHGISNELSQETGKYFEDICPLLLEHIQMADLLIAHNLEFDLKIFKTELYHVFKDDIVGMKNAFSILQHSTTFCTMLSTTKFCGLKPNGQRYNKFPKLSELYVKLFDEEPNVRLHDAASDCEICLKCYLYLKQNHPELI